MTECDHTQCSQDRDYVVEYEAGGDVRHYCRPHFEAIRDRVHVRFADVQRIGE